MNAPETRPASSRRIQKLISPLASLCAALALAASPLLRGAVSDVVVWDSIRTTTQLKSTLANGYPSMTGMRLWWRFNNASDLGADATGHGHTGTVKGVVSGLTMTDPFGVSRTVASGFNHDTCYVVGNPGFANGATADRTYEIWIRNPGKNGSVFFSITETEKGGGDDIKRLWVNTDGSLTIADYGSDAPRTQAHTTGGLTWAANQWYQIVVTFDHTTGNFHQTKVYRGVPGTPSSLDTPLLTYTGSSNAVTQTEHWLAIGGHEAGYYDEGSGKGGFLGCDGTGAAPTITPEAYGAVGNGTADDTAAWRKACAVLSAYGKGTLQLTAGKTYKVGKQDAGPWTNAPYYKAHGMGLILGATLGKITVNGNGATVKLASGLRYGAFNPSTGAANPGQTTDPLYAAAPGDLLKIQACVDVEVHDITLHGNIDNQIWGGLWSNLAGDTGIQLPQSGINLVGNNAVHLHDIQTNSNGLDGIDILNKDLDENSDLKTVLIERAYSYYNGRQGLSYNCGNHLKVYDSVFAHTAKVSGKANSPGAGVDIEPMGRYMAPGTYFQNCKFFNNGAAGVLLVHAPGVIFRDCVMWGTTTFGVKIDAQDTDHVFIDSTIYGGVYTRGTRIRFDSCSILNPPTAYFSANFPNAAVANKIGIEQTAGSITASACTIEALQSSKSVYLNGAATLKDCIVTHGNDRIGTGTYIAGQVGAAFLWNTKFRETANIAADYPGLLWYVHDSGGASKIGPGISIEGPTAGSDHYVLWSASSGTRPGNQTINVDVADGVLTPNAGPGEVQIGGTTPTYTAVPIFNNPADSTGARLFDKDLPADDWNNAVGRNNVDQTVTVDLKVVRNVRSVKLRMKHAQKPLRVHVEVGDGSSWTPMGTLHPLELEATTLAPWFDVTLGAPLSGRYVRLRFENEGLWGWYINEVKVYGY